MTFHANLAFYEAAAQIIPILLLALAVGESRIKPALPNKALSAIGFVSITGGLIVVGELAALRVLSKGHDSEFLNVLTTLSLGLGMAFLLQYLALATFRDVAGPDATPSLTVINALFCVSAVVSTATVLFVSG